MTMAATAAVIGAGGAVAGGLLSGGGQGQQENTTQTKSVAPWLLPYQKAQVERQYNLSNQPYQAYPGFFQQFASAMQQEQAPKQNPWDNLQMAMAGRPLMGGAGDTLVDRNVRPFNPLTPYPGEKVPLAVSKTDNTRYNQMLESNPDYQPRTMNPKQMAEWNKTNKGLKKYMADKPYMIKDRMYAQKVQQNLAQAQQADDPNIIDQYYAPRSLKGLLG